MNRVETLSKTFTGANTLKVVAGTNTPQGGDAGHGGVTVLELRDEGGTCWHLVVEDNAGFIKRISDVKTIRLELFGDSEAATFIGALKFALKVFELQRESGNE
jgi:hypothetical protein